jgi:hypothetical protein
MNPVQLQKLLAAKPFQAFTLHVSDQASYAVPSPEFILSTKSGRSIAVLSSDGETFSIVDMLHVTRVTTDNAVDLAAEEPRRRQA